MFNPYEYFKGKNVLLIGNGEKINQIDYSKYNSIVRMNLGVQDKPCDGDIPACRPSGAWFDKLTMREVGAVLLIAKVAEYTPCNPPLPSW